MEYLAISVVPQDYPELAALAWNRDPCRPLSPEEAFALYERNWRFVDRPGLDVREAALIDALTVRFGHGHFLG